MFENKSIQHRIIEAEEGRSLWHLGALLSFKALGSETNEQFWALEGFADKHLAVPLHVHSHEDEMWYVLDGEIRFILANETKTCRQGAFVYIPRNVPHTFQIISETARWFGIGTPAGLDQWFFETGEPALKLTLPPPANPPNIEMIVSSLKKYGTETLGPPPGI